MIFLGLNSYVFYSFRIITIPDPTYLWAKLTKRTCINHKNKTNIFCILLKIERANPLTLVKEKLC